MSVPIQQESPCISLVWCRTPKRESAVTAARRMAECAGQHFGANAFHGGDDRLGWTLRVPTKRSPLCGWSIFADGFELCLVEGDFYEDPPGVQTDSGEVRGLAAAVAQQIRTEEGERISGLIGVWSGVYVNARRETAFVFGDVTGSRPIFWYGENSDFIVGNSLWSFRNTGLFQPEWDPVALNQRLSIGVPLSGRTWIKDVKIVMRGQQVRASADGKNRVNDLAQRYSRRSMTHRQAVENLRAATDTAIRRVARRSGDGFGLALSGGLDSRILLASISTQNLAHKSITYCKSPAEVECQIAKRCAAMVGSPHGNAILDDDLATSVIPDALFLNQGESRAYAHMLTGMQAAKQQIRTLVVGYPADVFAGHPMGGFDFQRVRTVGELAAKMLKAYHQWLKPDELSLILDPSLQVPWADQMDEWNLSFVTLATEIPDLYIDHLLDYRLQRRTYPRLDQSRPWCVPIMTYIHENVYAAYRQLPLAEIVEERAHVDLLCNYATDLENIPSSAKAFLRLPLKYEFKARKLVQLLRTVRAASRQIIGTSRENRKNLPSGITPSEDAIFVKLSKHEIFETAGIEQIHERAKRGEFDTSEILQQLRCMTLIHDLLFGGGLAKADQPRYVPLHSELNWLSHSAAKRDEVESQGTHSMTDLL